MNTILVFIKKEFLQLIRDPKMFVIILAAPVLQLIFLGYAATMDVNNINTVILDNDKTNFSKEFINKFTNSGYFTIISNASNYQTVTENINNNKAILAIIIPQNFEKDYRANKPVKIQAVFDGSDGNKSSIVAGYVQLVLSYYLNKLGVEFFNKHGIKIESLPKLEAETRVWFNPELKTRNFMVPGIVGLLLMIITLLLTSLAIVKEKELGTLEQLIVTPIRPYQLIIGKMVPFSLLGFVAIIIVITAMRIVFNLPVKGSIIFLLFSSAIFMLNTLGFGLFISIFSKTQQQAMMLAIFGFMMPMIFLSGFSFPVENMPTIIRAITYIIPVKYFMTIIRGIILKGIGFNELWQDLLILFIMGITILTLSITKFNKKLE